MSETDVITPATYSHYDVKPTLFPPVWLILGVVGSSLGFTWLVLLFFLPWFTSGVAGNTAIHTELNISVAIVCIMLVLAAGAVFSDHFRGFKRRQALYIVAVALYVLGVACTLLPLETKPEGLITVAVILSTTGMAILVLLWSLCFATIRRGVVNSVLAAMFLTTGALVLLIASLQETPRLVITIILPIGSSAVFLALHLRLLATFKVHQTADARGHYSISKLSLYTTLITGLPVGIAASYVMLLNTAANTVTISLIVGLPMLAAGAVMLINALKLKFFTENLFLHWFSSENTLPLLALPFLPEEGKLICCGLLVFFIGCNSTQCFIAISEITSFNGLSVFRTFGVSWLMYALGFAAGLLLPWVVAAAFPGTVSEIILILSLTYLLIVSGQLFRDNSVSDESSSAEIGATVKSSLWKEKIDKVVETYELSPRQHEVLRLLSRGRNAKYLQETFYISRSTAKAHIYNIYKRLEVHSQQELIDLIENIDERGESA